MEKENVEFTEKQIEFMRSYGIDINNLDNIFDVIEPLHRKSGFDIDYKIDIYRLDVRIHPGNIG